MQNSLKAYAASVLLAAALSGCSRDNANDVDTLASSAAASVTMSFTTPRPILTTTQKAKLTWSSDGGICRPGGDSAWSRTGSQAPNGSSTVGPFRSPGTKTLSLRCYAGTVPTGASTSKTVTLTVSDSPAMSFTATRTELTTMQTTALKWSSNGGICRPSGEASWKQAGDRPPNGAKAIGPFTTPGTKTVSLRCFSGSSASGPSVARSIKLTVLGPPSASFTASRTALTTTQTTELTWSSNGGICRPGGDARWSRTGDKLSSGSETLGPFATPGTKKISLRCFAGSTASGPSTTRNISLNVTQDNRTFNLAGTMVPAAGTRVDGDVNDPDARYLANDSPQTVQALHNGSRLGGYLNVAGAGKPGRSQQAGDVYDGYRVRMHAGQFANLYIGDTDAGDLDLLLYSGDGATLIAFSNSGTSNMESVKAPADGEYLVVPFAFSGASTYVLGIEDYAAARHAMRSDMDIVPGSVVLAFDEKIVAKSLDSAEARAAELGGLQHTGGAPGEAMRFKANRMRLEAAHSAFREKLSATRAGMIDAKAASVALADRFATLSLVKELGKRSDVSYAEPELLRTIQAQPGDPLYPSQGHYPLISLPEAWDMTTGSADVLVAVVDTGVLTNHPDIAGNLDPNDRNGVDFISDPARSNDGDGVDGNADDPGDAAALDGGGYHGTHVAGTIAAVTNNAQGVAGVCWRCRIMPIRVLGNEGSGSSYDILQGMLYAAGLSNASGILPVKRADIINLSLGGPGYSQATQDAIQRIVAAGVLVVAAAGNDGTGNLSYPASYSQVVSVGAVTPSRTRAPFSQFNAAVSVVAPGTGVGSTVGRGQRANPGFEYGYGSYNGTSMATPHVAGVAALMKSLYPAMRPEQFHAAVRSFRIVDDLGPQGRDDQYGWGLINAAKAVRHAIELSGGVPDNAPLLQANPKKLDLGTQQTELRFALQNAGGGSLTINSVSCSACPGWLSLIAPDNTLKPGEYRVRVNRTGLAPGIYGEVLRFTSSANSETVEIRMEVEAGAAADDSGRHYMLLIPKGSNVATHYVEVEANEGRYRWRFENVPAGSYFIAAGTDHDNDGFICDAGEACGYYPDADINHFFEVNASRNGINFTTGFSIFMAASTSSLTMPIDEAEEQGYRIPR